MTKQQLPIVQLLLKISWAALEQQAAEFMPKPLMQPTELMAYISQTLTSLFLMRQETLALWMMRLLHPAKVILEAICGMLFIKRMAGQAPILMAK